MNVKKNLFLMGWGSVIVILLAACGYLLFRERSGFVDAKEKLAGAESSLDSLNRRNPFPSDANVAVTATNLTVLQIVFEDFMDHLSADQIREEPMEGARFLTVLEETRDALNTAAMDFDVLVPPQFAYGFDSYAMGSIPDTEDVPRLSVQLQMAESLAGLMFSNRISAINSLNRTIFEQPLEGGAGGGMPMLGGGGMFGFDGFAPPPGFGDPGLGAGAGGAGASESDLYSVEHFNVVFTAKGPSVMDTLRGLASSADLFAVVTDISAQSGATLDGGMGGIGGLGGMGGVGGGYPSPMIGGMRGMGGGPMGAFGGLGELGPGPGLGMDEFTPLPGMMGGAGASMRRQLSPDELGRQVLLREDRKVAGEELLQVSMGVDLYRFKRQGDEEGAADGMLDPETGPAPGPGGLVDDPFAADTEL